MKEKESSSEESEPDSEEEDEGIQEAVRQSLHQKALEEQEMQRLREMARGAQSSSGAAFQHPSASASPSLQQIFSTQCPTSTEMANFGPEEVRASQTIAEISLQARMEAEKLMAAEQQAQAEAEAFAAVTAKAREESTQAQVDADQSDGDQTAATHSEDEIQGHIAGLRSAMSSQQPEGSQGLHLDPESETPLSDVQHHHHPQEADVGSAMIPYPHQPQTSSPQPQQQPQSTSTSPNTHMIILSTPSQFTSHPPSTSAPQPSSIPTSTPPPEVPNPPTNTSLAHSPAEIQLLLQNIHDLASRMDRVEASNRDLAAHIRAQDQLMLQMMQMLRDMQNRGP